MSMQWWGPIFYGDEAAIVAAQLVDPMWLPGRPGNNKLSQSVVFENGGALLIRGKGRGRPYGSKQWINISRDNASNLRVSRPWTDSEKRIIDAVAKSFGADSTDVFRGVSGEAIAIALRDQGRNSRHMAATAVKR